MIVVNLLFRKWNCVNRVKGVEHTSEMVAHAAGACGVDTTVSKNGLF